MYFNVLFGVVFSVLTNENFRKAFTKQPSRGLLFKIWLVCFESCRVSVSSTGLMNIP